jgi:hypothetical protein
MKKGRNVEHQWSYIDMETYSTKKQPVPATLRPPQITLV